MPSVASVRKEDGSTTDQSDQLMSRFSDTLCFVLFSSSVPSFLLLRFWPERDPAPSVYLYSTLTSSFSLLPAIAYTCIFSTPNLRPQVRSRTRTPREAAYTRVSRFNELFIYFQVDIDDRASFVHLARDVEGNVSLREEEGFSR